MPKTKISEFSATPANNTDIDSINIAEGCAPSGINDAIRELMAQLKDFQTGAVGDSFNGPVGTTTAAAGAFTTLAASGAVTLSGGTANGVTYLNGSKVLTSGSALVFDGTNMAVGTTPTSFGAGYSVLTVQGSTTGFVQASNGTIVTEVGTFGGIGYTGTRSNHSYGFVVNGSEQMRLTSTGLGIGTSSPSRKLDVVVTSSTTYSAADNANNLNLFNSSTTDGTFASIRLGAQGSGSGGIVNLYGVQTAASGSADFVVVNRNAGTFQENLRLNSAGNLGLGVTPSAWSSTFKGFQLGTTGSIWAIASGNGGTYYGNNYYFASGGRTYLTTGTAAEYSQASGAHAWSIAPSGTAGNAISFTQAMTLDASGNLGIGTTSPTARLHLVNSAAACNLIIDGQDAANKGALITFRKGGSDKAYLGQGSTILGGGSTSNDLVFYTEGAINQIFYTNGAERARIDSSGNLLVGTTSQLINNARLSTQGVYTSDSNTTTYSTQRAAAVFRQDGGSGSNNQGSYSALVLSTNVGAATSPGVLMRGYGGSSGTTYNIQINENGNITNANNSYGSLSDVSLKENIVDSTPKLNDLMAVQIRSYNLIANEKKTKHLGVIAQELETVFPSMVEVEPDGLKSVKYSVFVPMLIKALQELKTEFDAYKASHP